jgi:hypothetical protein
MLTLSMNSLFKIVIVLSSRHTTFSHWTFTHLYFGPLFLILLTYFISYGISIFFKLISDRMIIFCLSIFLFLCGCSNRMSLETNYLFNQRILSTIFCCFGILILKLILLLIRFYYWSMPTSVAAGIITYINFYLSFNSHCVYVHTTTNRPMIHV